MKKEKIEILESAIKRTATFLKTEIIKEEAWTWNIFSKRFRYMDQEGRRYKAAFKKGNVLVNVSASRKNKQATVGKQEMEFIIAGEKFYRKTDLQMALNFIHSFFAQRKYNIRFLEAKEKTLPYKKWKRIFFVEDEHCGEVEIVKTFPRWEITVKDSEESGPYFCTQGYYYRFKLKSCIDPESKQDILIEYEEREIDAYKLFSISSIKKVIYGFHSPNLRAFYSDEGLFPEVQHNIKLSVYANLGMAIINASVFVRVAEKLQGNTWYTLAAGVLVFIRAPAESFYVKKSLGISKHFPSTIVKDAMESDEFKRFAERKDVRIWRNFEKKLYDIVRKKENFALLIEQYGALKKDINSALEENNRDRIQEILKEQLKFNNEELAEINYFLEHLEPLDIKGIQEGLMESIELLLKSKVFKPHAELTLKKYIEEIFPINLLTTTFSKTFKIVRDRIKQEERLPLKQDVARLVSMCKNQVLPFRLIDISLFISLYCMGYIATFVKTLPDLVIPIYYILYGAAANVVNAAVLRLSSPVNMQYLYRNLENAPTISSAADAWNEYQAHLMRIWAVFSSIGLIIGVIGKLLAATTHNTSRYVVEFFALFLYIKSFREWYFYYSTLEAKTKTEE